MHTIQATYAIHGTPFGEFLVIRTSKGICFAAFIDGNSDTLLQEMQQKLGITQLNQESQQASIKNIFDHYSEHALDFIGTDFQKKVWHELRTIARGTTISYSDLAARIGDSRAVRAVASAVAANNIAFFIPCHRVIKKSGEIHKYRWGATRKKLMLESELL